MSSILLLPNIIYRSILTNGISSIGIGGCLQQNIDRVNHRSQNINQVRISRWNSSLHKGINRQRHK